MCHWELILTHGLAIEWSCSRPYIAPNPQTGRWAESPPLNLQPDDWKLRKCQWNTFDKTFAGAEFVPWAIIQLSLKPQISERRSNTICAVVERPDHHFGDDLVWGNNSVPSDLQPNRKKHTCLHKMTLNKWGSGQAHYSDNHRCDTFLQNAWERSCVSDIPLSNDSEFGFIH